MANAHHVIGTGPHKVIALHGWFADRHGFAPMEKVADGRRIHLRVHGLSRLRRHEGRRRRFHDGRDRRGHAGARRRAGMARVQPDRPLDGRQGDPARADARAVAREETGGADARPGLERSVRRSRAGRSSTGAAENPANRYGIIDFTTGNRLSKTWIDRMVAYSLECSTRAAFAAYLARLGEDRLQRRREGTDASGARDRRRA